MKLLTQVFVLLGSVLCLCGCNAKSEMNLNKAEEKLESKKNSLNNSHLDSVIYRIPSLPDTLFFAGERVPLEKEEVRQKLLEELILHANRHGRVLITRINLPFWETTVRKELSRNAIPQDFLYLAIAESDFEVNAISPTGAAGLWQIMPETAREYNILIDDYTDQRRDIEKSTEFASKYLQKAKERFGNWSLAAASYNRGQNGISNALEKQKVDNLYDLYLNPETARYFYRILATKLVYENPEKYGFGKNIEQKISLKASERFVMLGKGEYSTVELAKKYNMTFSQLKTLNPWMIDLSRYRLIISGNSTLKVRIKKLSSEAADN